jgi:hypothetical protein
VPSWLLWKRAAWGVSVFPVNGLDGRAVDHVDVEPAVVVVIQQGDARAGGLKDIFLFERSHLVMPGGESRLLGDVLENHRTVFDETAGGDGSAFGIKDWSEHAGGSRSAARCGLDWAGGGGRLSRRSAVLRTADRGTSSENE